MLVSFCRIMKHIPKGVLSPPKKENHETFGGGFSQRDVFFRTAFFPTGETCQEKVQEREPIAEWLFQTVRSVKVQGTIF